MSSDQYQSLYRYLHEGEPIHVPGPEEIYLPTEERLGLEELAPHLEVWMETELGPAAAIRAGWVAIDGLFNVLKLKYLSEPWSVFFKDVEPILEFVGNMPLGPRHPAQHLFLVRAEEYWHELDDDILPLGEEAGAVVGWPQDILSAVLGLMGLLQAMTQYSSGQGDPDDPDYFVRSAVRFRSRENTYYYVRTAVTDAAMSYSALYNPGSSRAALTGPDYFYFLEWWWQRVQERIPVRGADTAGPRLSTGVSMPSQSRSLREYYEQAFEKWKTKKGYVVWDSVKTVFDSVYNTSDFRKLTDSIGLPVTHLPGVGKALKAVGNFVLSSLWVAPKMAKAVVEETGLPPEKVERVFAIAKGIDSVTPGPWGSGIIILYYALATAGKAPSKAAVKKALAVKAKLIERLRGGIERERSPKMRLVAAGPKSSSRKDPLRDLTRELNDIAKDKKALEKNAPKTADLALEIGTWVAEFEDIDEALDALEMAVIPAHERLVSQGDEYESENLLDMAVYMADQTLEDLEESTETVKLAAGPRFDSL